MPHAQLSPDQVHRDGCYLVDPTGHRYLNLGFVPAPAAPLQPEAAAAQIERSFAAACARCEILGQLEPGASGWQVHFTGQENASAARILQAFHEEALAAGLLTGTELRLHPDMGPADHSLVEQRLALVVQRLRTLLIEHNSYLSGGLRYPFSDALQGVAERGLAIYRFPLLAEVDVVAENDSIRIRFAADELGAVTSSGFYLPTLFGGDFTVTAAYQLGTWLPCAEEAACFALFAQNESSTHRYYAQRMSTGTQPHRLLASMAESLTPEQDVQHTSGRFRIDRRGDTMSCWHGPEDPAAPWTQLGTAPAPVEREMILGAKIWSKIRCEGLEARITGLRIEGEMAERQIAPVPVRPDPRSNSQGPT